MPELLQNRYEISKLLGRARSKVFLATDHKTGQEIAVKQVKEKPLFSEEIKTLEKLGKHPQIPELFDYFEEDGYYYLILEYVVGRSLGREFARSGVFDQGKIRFLLRELLPVLDFIHRHQVIHLDIKPENIVRKERCGSLVLIDFGNLPNQFDVRGFSSPELMNGTPTYASDFYSLGVTCFYLLTGVFPFDLFDVDSLEWVWTDFLDDNRVDRFEERILNKMVALDIKDRYQSADEVLSDLGYYSLRSR